MASGDLQIRPLERPRVAPVAQGRLFFLQSASYEELEVGIVLVLGLVAVQARILSYVELGGHLEKGSVCLE